MKELQSFTRDIKEEIISKPFDDERKKALLSAYIKTNGSISIKNRQTLIKLQTENAKVAQYVFLVLKSFYQISPKIEYQKQMRFDKKVLYSIVIEEQVDFILKDLEVDLLESKISRTYAKNDNVIGGYLAGAFLASGSCNTPSTSNYHLEISQHSDSSALWLKKLILQIKSAMFDPKIVKRRNQSVVYLKKSDQISNFLIYLGAVDSCLIYENKRVDREFSNIENRLHICDTANMEKVLKANREQINLIKLLNNKIGLDNIGNDKLRAFCYLRLEHEEASMSETALLLGENLGIEISKSSINHLVRALKEMCKRFL